MNKKTENQEKQDSKKNDEIKKQKPQDNDKIKQLEALISELKDQSIRALAEAENTRKRAEKEISEAHKYAVTNITKDLIDVLENLYRATEHIDQKQENSTDQIKTLIEGVEMTKSSFIKVLERYGVLRIDPAPGDEFDHNLHQAISQEESKDFDSGKITKVVQAGYKIGDRLTRPVMVIVSR